MPAIELDDVIPRLEVRNGITVVILDDTKNEPVLLILPKRDPWRPVHRLAVACDRMRDELRLQRDTAAQRGGRVIVGPEPHRPISGG